MSNKSLSSTTIIYTIGNFASKLIGFVLVFFITFYLTKADVGRYDIIITTISMFVPLINLQLTDGILRWLLVNNDDTQKKIILTNSLLIFLLNSILFTIIYVFVVQYIKEDFKLIIYFLLLLQSLFPLVQIFTRGVGKNMLFAASGVVYSFFYTGFTILSLLVFHLKVDGLLLANIVAIIITVIYLLVYGNMFQYISFRYFDRKFIKEIIVYSLPIIPNAYSWWLYSSANRYVILYFLGLEFSGIWAISYKLPTIFTMFSGIFFMAWQEKSIREFNSPNRDEYFSSVLKTFISLSLGIIVVLVACSKTLLYFIVQKSFFISWQYTSLLLMAGLFQSLSLFYGVGYLYAKETKKILYTTLIGSVVTLIFSVFLIKFTGLYGVAFASALGFFVMFILRLKQTKIYFTITFPIKKTLYLLAAVVICNMLNYVDSFYVQAINIAASLLIFYMANRLFLNNKISSLKVVLLNKYNAKK